MRSHHSMIKCLGINISIAKFNAQLNLIPSLIEASIMTELLTIASKLYQCANKR